MPVRILPNSSMDEDTIQFLKETGQGGVELSTSYTEKVAASESEEDVEVVAEEETEKEASLEKEAVTKEEQAEYWRQYFAEAGMEADFADWLQILFG